MEHLLRPPSDAVLPAADALLEFPRCLQVLEAAVADLLGHAWEDPYRTKALELVKSLISGCKVCGFRESSGLLRSLDSLLCLSADDVGAIRQAVADRMREILALLRQQALSSRTPAKAG